MRVTLLATVAFLVWLAAPPQARASGGEVTLRWEPHPSVEGCPEADQIQAEIDAMLPESARDGEGVVVHAHVDPVDEGLQLELWAQRGVHAGRRVLQSNTCETLAEAAALIVTMLVAPEVSPPTPEAPSSDAEPAPELPTGGVTFDSGWLAADDDAVEDPFEQPDLGPIDAMRLAVDGGIAVGQLPGPSPQLGLRLELCVERFCPFVAGMFVFPASEALGAPQGASIELWLAIARVGLRHRSERGAFGFGPTGALDVGAVAATVDGISDADSALTAWLSIAAGGFADVGNGKFRAGLSVEGQVPLLRPSFVVDPLGEVYRSSPVGLLASLWVEATFR